jgi:hypothetical protein
MKKYLISLIFVFLGSIVVSEEIPEKDKKKDFLLVTNLIKNSPLSLKHPSEYCLEDNYLYEGATHRAGELNVFILPDRNTEIPGDRFVIIRGSVQKGLDKKLTKKSECPAGYGEKESSQQIRSDWVADETGFSVGKSSTEKMKTIAYIEAENITAFKGFTLSRDSDKKMYKAVFTNNLKVPVKNLKLVAHYESHGFGKPMPHFTSKKFPLVKPGQKATYIIPETLENKDKMRGRKQKYSFHSAKVSSHSNDLRILLEIFKRSE